MLPITRWTVSCARPDSVSTSPASEALSAHTLSLAQRAFDLAELSESRTKFVTVEPSVNSTGTRCTVLLQGSAVNLLTVYSADLTYHITGVNPGGEYANTYSLVVDSTVLSGGRTPTLVWPTNVVPRGSDDLIIPNNNKPVTFWITEYRPNMFVCTRFQES